MKKTFVVEVDFNHEAEDLYGALGTTAEDLAELFTIIVKTGALKGLKQSEIILYLMENDLITGGQLLTMACLHIDQIGKALAEKLLPGFLDKLNEG